MTSLALEPYPGLRPYREDEQDKFFGRDADKHVLVDKILNNRLTLLFAASGVGKSSLLQASIIPYLKAEQGENLTVVYYIDWVSEPIHHLRQAIWLALQTEGLLAADSEIQGSTLGEALEFCSLFVRHPLVLILDQFEEFFRYQAPQQRQAFISQLTSVITNTPLPVSLVISMREDFALELNAFKPRLPTILFENFYRLEKLGREATEQAIVQPVARLEFAYEPALLSALLNDLLSRELDRNPHSPVAELRMNAEPPYLQIVCAHLWQLNQTDPEKTLRFKTYQQAGRAKGILENYIKGILQPLSRPEKDLASQAFDHLVGQRGVKKAYTASALASTLQAKEADLQKLLETLEQARILRKQQRGAEIWYELYHDMFSSSLEAWNLAWKEQMRRRRFFKGAFLGLSVLAVVVVTWDFYINYTSYHLRLSPQAGLYDRVELWQGKLNSWDLFQQQQYLAETDFERERLEPDKLFSKKQLLDIDSLAHELTGLISLDQRIEGYSMLGEHEQALNLANKFYLSDKKEVINKTTYALFKIRTIKTIDIIKKILSDQNNNDNIKKSISNGEKNNIPLCFMRLITRFNIDESNPYQNKILIESILNRQLGIKKTISILTRLLQKPENPLEEIDRTRVIKTLAQLKHEISIYFLINSIKKDDLDPLSEDIVTLGQLKATIATPQLINLLTHENTDIRSNAAKALGLMQAKNATPNLIKLLNKDQESEVFSSAVTSLGQIKATIAIPHLISLIKNRSKIPSEDFKDIEDESLLLDSVIEALGVLQAIEAIPTLKKLLQKNEPSSTRLSAAEALYKIKPETETETAISTLMDLLKDTTSLNIESVVDTLIQIKPNSSIPLDIIIDSLTDENILPASAVAADLGGIEMRKKIKALINLLKIRDSTLNSSGNKALDKFKPDAFISISTFHDILNYRGYDLTTSTASTLVNLEENAVLPTLLSLLKSKKSDIRYEALFALNLLEVKIPILDLIKSLKDENSEIRYQALYSLKKFKSQSIIPYFLPLLTDENSDVRNIAFTALRAYSIKEAITLELDAINSDYIYSINSEDEYANTDINHFKLSHLKVDFYPALDGYFEHISDISGAELIDLTLRKLSSIDEEESEKALRAALKLKNNGYLNSLQIKIIDKALSQIDPELIKTAEQSIAKEKQELAEEEKSRRPINQPYPETKPLSLDALKAKLNQLDQDYAEWRKQRDTETNSNSTTGTLEDSETKKLKNLEREVYLYNYAFAIARMDQESGIELLKHNLFKVRQAAASGLVNSDQFTPQLLERLEQAWLTAKDPIIRQSLYHAIDTSLLVLEGIGGQAELDFLTAYQPKLTDSASLASIQPRVEWTIFQLQWRMDQVKDLDQLGKDQEPELLERYCINPDSTDKKPEECTMRPY